MTVRCGTYSIVARDDAAGQIGVAVQSHWFSVGSVVTWGRAGVGVVATQSIAEPAYGPRALDRLRGGSRGRRGLRQLLAEDPQAAYRQVAVMGTGGPAAAHTGAGCIPFAGHAVGAGLQRPGQPHGHRRGLAGDGRGVRAGRRGPLARRLLAPWSPGEEAGGDVRGRQSAALARRPGARRAVGPRRRVARGGPPRPARRARPPAHGERGVRARDRRRRPRRPGAPRGGRRVLPGRGAAGARQRRAAVLGRARSRGRRRPGDCAARRGAAPSRSTPGWRDLLERLSPEVAPGAPVVLEAQRSRSSRYRRRARISR